MATLNPVSRHESADINSHFLSAEEVDVGPLLEESTEALGLDANGTSEMAAYLSEAWFTGVRAGHTQILGRLTERGSKPEPVDIKPIEARFRSMMERAADALNLSIPLTIKAWGLLGRAWMAGTRAYEAELTATLLERESGVADEAMRWLNERPDENP